MIPKIIWQTHENKYNDLLPFQKNIINTWKNLNPKWEYRYVNAEERYLEVKQYGDIAFNYYINADKIHQADIWRFITIYKYGGFYADLDSICTQSIDDSLLKITKMKNWFAPLWNTNILELIIQTLEQLKIAKLLNH